MKAQPTSSRFKAKLYRPAKAGKNDSWTFLFLPKEASDQLPRRGRTSVDVTLNGHPFLATLEPDGQLSHWLKVSEELRIAAGVEVGDLVSLELSPVENEPDPEVPTDFKQALQNAPEAQRVWKETTTIARLDWIHWITSAKQMKTREKRIRDACEMLSEGKKRVCCFDSSGFYSKAFRAPEAAS